LIFTYNALLRRVATLVLPLLYRGNALTCPCCERSFRKFIRRYQEDTLCPGCLSLRRHRLLLLYLLAETRITSRGLAVLHLAPEEGLQARLSAIAGPGYVSMDAHSASIAMVTGDITAIPFDPESLTWSFAAMFSNTSWMTVKRYVSYFASCGPEGRRCFCRQSTTNCQ
jgi:hypothetical protein